MEAMAQFEWRRVAATEAIVRKRTTVVSAALVGHLIFTINTSKIYNNRADPVQHPQAHLLDTSSEIWRQLPLSFDSILVFTHTLCLVDDSILFLAQLPSSSLTQIDVFVLDPVEIEIRHVNAYGSRPPLMQMHVLNYYDHSREVLVYGGGLHQRTAGDLWSLDVEFGKWRVWATKGKKPWTLQKHGSCIMNHTLFIVGGTAFRRSQACSKIFLLMLRDCSSTRSSPSWQNVDVAGVNPGMLHLGCLVGIGNGKMLLYGGSKRDVPTSTMYVLEGAMSDRPEWHICVRSGAKYRFSGMLPPPRIAASCFYTGNKLIVLGGSYIDGPRYFELNPVDSTELG